MPFSAARSATLFYNINMCAWNTYLPVSEKVAAPLQNYSSSSSSFPPGSIYYAVRSWGFHSGQAPSGFIHRQCVQVKPRRTDGGSWSMRGRETAAALFSAFIARSFPRPFLFYNWKFDECLSPPPIRKKGGFEMLLLLLYMRAGNMKNTFNIRSNLSPVE